MKVIILIGAPGSGKSTWGKKLAQRKSYIYLSSDENRARLGKNEDDQSVSAKAFYLMEEEFENALKKDQDVILDATFMTKRSRMAFLDIAKDYNAKCIAVTFEIPREEILKRNLHRANTGGRNVPVDIIDRFINKYERPTKDEFDGILTITH